MSIVLLLCIVLGATCQHAPANDIINTYCMLVSDIAPYETELGLVAPSESVANPTKRFRYKND